MRYLSSLMLLIAQVVAAQSFFVKSNVQKCFPRTVPPGNYSGITYLGGDKYAVVSDKSGSDGFYTFRIKVDSLSGEILNVENLGFNDLGTNYSDIEGIAYNDKSGRIYLCSEKAGKIIEYDYFRKEKTGNELALSEYYPEQKGNGGIESVSYNSSTDKIWTINEMPISKDDTGTSKYKLRINSFDSSFCHSATYAYEMDSYENKNNPYMHVEGVSELAALDDGRLLVLERVFHVPQLKIGAYCICRVYLVNPQKSICISNEQIQDSEKAFMQKEKLCEWKTKLSLFKHKIANFEGMCLGPKLADGKQILLFVSDSQNQYHGILKDWFKSVIISPAND